MFELFHSGGPVLWPIGACSVVALGIFLERWFHLHRAQIKGGDFIKGIFNNVQRGNIVEAVSLCEETPGPVARIVRSGILEFRQGPDRVRQVMEDAGMTEIARLEHRLGLLLTLAQITPLLGLLGTILGMMQVLDVIHRKAPLVLAADVSGGMWQALLASAAGLLVAILAYAGYNFLVFLVERVVLDMERAVAEVTSFLGRVRPAPEA